MANARELDIETILSHLEYNKETGEIYWKVSTGKAKSGSDAGVVHQTGYKRITLKGRTLMAHRVAWVLAKKEQPPAIIDHIDGDKLNNRIENLRDGTNCTNQRNQSLAHKRNKSSNYLGVSIFQGRWRAKIYSNGKYIFLGYHDTEEQAKKAYDDAKEIYHKQKRRD